MICSRGLGFKSLIGSGLGLVIIGIANMNERKDCFLKDL